MAALALGVVRIDPAMVVEHDPERLFVHHCQVRHDGHQHILLALFMQRASEVMVVDDIVFPVGTDHDGDHVPAEQFRFLLVLMFAPAGALFLDLPHADRHLRRPQRKNGNGCQNRFTFVRHYQKLRGQYRHFNPRRRRTMRPPASLSRHQAMVLCATQLRGDSAGQGSAYAFRHHGNIVFRWDICVHGTNMRSVIGDCLS